MAIQAAVEESTKKTRAATPEEGARAGSVVQRVAEADPVLLNKFNQEPLVQSGVLWGGSAGVLSAIGTIMLQVGIHGVAFQQYDWGAMAFAISALASAAFVIYRRVMPGLKPLFSGWFGAK